MRPDAPFLASSSARPQAAALRDLLFYLPGRCRYVPYEVQIPSERASHFAWHHTQAHVLIELCKAIAALLAYVFSKSELERILFELYFFSIFSNFYPNFWKIIF